MSDVNFWQHLITKVSGGFVVALHEIPPEQLVRLVGNLRPAKAVPLGELVRRLNDSKPTSGLYAITVDDGVGDNVRALAGLAASNGLPVTFYLPTAYVDTQEGMAFQWWRRLKPLLPRRKLELRMGILDLSRPEAVEQLSRRMEWLWHSQRLETYLPLTMELAAAVERELGTTRAAFQPPKAITWPEVERLSKNELIQFESHGVSHAAMSSLSEGELIFEMKHSRDILAEHTGRSCRHLAYPFGSSQSIGDRAASIARRYYDSATTMSLGRIDSANPWLLPRLALYPQNSNYRLRLKILLNCGGIRRSHRGWRIKPVPFPHITHIPEITLIPQLTQVPPIQSLQQIPQIRAELPVAQTVPTEGTGS